MAVTSERQNGTLIARVDGRVDGSNAREFQTELESTIDESARIVILDLGQLSYISSAGLRVILMIARTLQRREAKFGICSLSEPIREVFQISGFDKIISTHDSQEDALAALSA